MQIIALNQFANGEILLENMFVKISLVIYLYILFDIKSIRILNKNF